MKMHTHKAARFIWMAVTLMVAGLFCAAWGQSTNGTLTNLPPASPTNPFPAGTDAIWFAVIPVVTFGITWLVGKIRSLPPQVIPLLTPIIGVAVGSLIQWATNAHFPWWSQAGAGAVSVAIYEALKGLTGAGPESKLTPNAGQKKVVNT